VEQTADFSLEFDQVDRGKDELDVATMTAPFESGIV
jgi:hypothetical protein